MCLLRELSLEFEIIQDKNINRKPHRQNAYKPEIKIPATPGSGFNLALESWIFHVLEG